RIGVFVLMTLLIAGGGVGGFYVYNTITSRSANKEESDGLKAVAASKSTGRQDTAAAAVAKLDTAPTDRPGATSLQKLAPEMPATLPAKMPDAVPMPEPKPEHKVVLRP